MPGLDWADVTAIITLETVIPVVIVGLALGAYYWRLPARVDGPGLLSRWIVGIAFFTVMGVGRWTAGSEHWEAWIGTAILWTLFVVTGGAVMWMARLRIRRKARL